jgi:LysR family glycine cleavage system transcriptional activator
MPARDSISLLALRAFEAAARRLSFTEAARELHISQAAVSRHIRSLESELNRPLFRRLHRRVELTPAGRKFAAALSIGFQHIRQAVRDARGGGAKPLRLSVEPAFAARWLVPRLRSFTVAHPEIELQLETSDQFRALGADMDIAIRYLSKESRRRLPAGRRLFSIEGVPVAAAKARRRPHSGDDTEVLGRLLLHDDDGHAWRSWFAVAGLDGFDLARHQYFSDYSLLLEAAQEGPGVALGATAFIQPELTAGRLVQLGRTRVFFGTYWLLETRDRATRRSRGAFVRWLNAELESANASASGGDPTA